jgi:iron-sulfur cluster repair protein YtfE (RIC family)
MLEQAIAETPAKPDQTVQALITRILRRYHAVHRDELASLCRLAPTLELDRKEHRACPHGLADGPDESWQSLYAGCAKLYEDLCEHTRIENEELFPLFE